MTEHPSPYVDTYEAVRIIVRLLPGGEPLAPRMTDEWIKRGYAAYDDTPQVKGAYQRAAELLKQVVPSSRDIKITGVSSVGAQGRRQIADDERSLRLEIREGFLAGESGEGFHAAMSLAR